MICLFCTWFTKFKVAREKLRNMAECVVFEEDEVTIFDGKTVKCGLVLESSEFLSSEDEEESDFASRLKKGSIRVAWHPDGTEEELEESKVTVHKSRSKIWKENFVWIVIRLFSNRVASWSSKNLIPRSL